MTPSELRSLVEAATYSMDRLSEPQDIVEARKQLDRLAPELALLCADMAEALEAVTRHEGHTSDPRLCLDRAITEARNGLLGVAALGER